MLNTERLSSLRRPATCPDPSETGCNCATCKNHRFLRLTAKLALLLAAAALLVGIILWMQTPDTREWPIPVPAAVPSVETANVQQARRERLWRALCWVESGGNLGAIGDGGRSHGVAQIGAAYLQDANEHAGTSYTLADTHDPEKARAVFDVYMARWCPGGTDEEIARTHNGGPGWRSKPPRVLARTASYWEKVRRELER